MAQPTDTRNIIASLLLGISLTATAQTDTSDWSNVMIEASVENEQVRKYMEEVKYSGIIYRLNDAAAKSSSKILNYCDVETDYRKDFPAVIEVPLPHTLDHDAYLVMHNQKTPLQIDSIMIHAGAKSVSVTDLIPSSTYHYSVEGVTAGRIHATGQLRQLAFEGGFNTRDIGGYKTDDGRRIAYGKIYRGCELYDGLYAWPTGESIRKLSAMNVGAEIDLRLERNHNSKQMQDESIIGKDVTLLNLPMEDGSTMLIDYKEEYKTTFEEIHRQLSMGKSVYIHCTFGADRTGAMCAILEAMCGVSIGDMYKDYELTSMAAGYCKEELHRDLHSINSRILRQLSITRTDQLKTKVTDYLVNTCHIAPTIINELTEMLCEEDRDDVPEGIGCAVADTVTPSWEYYSIQGMRTKSPGKGISIVFDRNSGKTTKIIR